jgi:CHASE1-domain containing sensor protein
MNILLLKGLVKGIDLLFTFIVFVLLLGLCFIGYVYLTNQIISQRKRIMLLINENNELKNKLNKSMSSGSSSKAANTSFTDPPEETNQDFEET